MPCSSKTLLEEEHDTKHEASSQVSVGLDDDDLRRQSLEEKKNPLGLNDLASSLEKCAAATVTTSENYSPSPTNVPTINQIPSDAPNTESDALSLSKQRKRKSLVHFLALCFSVWLNGWNDGTLGPLLPRIQTNYQISFTIVSMLFVGNCAGFVIGAAVNVWLNDRYGLGKVIILGATSQFAGYVILVSRPPFPLMACAYVFLGLGISIQSAQANGFVGSLHQRKTTKLGLMHAAYGLGAFTSPFAATFFSSLSGRQWAFHFIISAVLGAFNVIFLMYAFRFRRQMDLLCDEGQPPNAEVTSPSGGNTYRQLIRLSALPWLILFAIIYTGVEVTIGGWIVTFIIRERHGGTSSGYISSGFFGGITAGRMGLVWLNERVGARRVIFVYTLIALGLELMVWFVPSIVVDSIAVALIGVVLGPIFPLLMSHISQTTSHQILTGCIGLVAGLGMAGSSLPFIAGLLASKYGIASLQPLGVSMIACMFVVWALLPNDKAKENDNNIA